MIFLGNKLASGASTTQGRSEHRFVLLEHVFYPADRIGVSRRQVPETGSSLVLSQWDT